MLKNASAIFFSLYLSSATLRQSFISSECKRRYCFYILVHRILRVRLSGQLFLDHLGHPARTNKLIRRYAKNNQTRPTNRHKARYVDLMAQLKREYHFLNRSALPHRKLNNQMNRYENT